MSLENSRFEGRDQYKLSDRKKCGGDDRARVVCEVEKFGKLYCFNVAHTRNVKRTLYLLQEVFSSMFELCTVRRVSRRDVRSSCL